MLKKGLALLLAVIMVFSLSGCSDILGGAFFLISSQPGMIVQIKMRFLRSSANMKKNCLRRLKTEIFLRMRIKALSKKSMQMKQLLIFPVVGLALAPIPPMWAFTTHRTMI